MTYDESARQALDYFEAQHQERMRANAEELAVRAENGDSWALGILHMRRSGHPAYANAMNSRPQLLAELRRPRT